MRWDRYKDKAHYRRMLRAIMRLKSWQLVVLLLLGILVAAPLLRLNNLQMVERRSAVLAADEKGDPEALKEAIVELQDYVTHHMNTNLEKGFYLSHTYERDRDRVLSQATQTTNPNSDPPSAANVSMNEI